MDLNNVREYIVIVYYNKIGELPEEILNLELDIDVDSDAAHHDQRRIFLFDNPIEKPKGSIVPYSVTAYNDATEKRQDIDLEYNTLYSGSTQLKNIISDNNKILSENPTLGKNSPSPIPNPITYDIIEKIVSYENYTQLSSFLIKILFKAKSSDVSIQNINICVFV